MLTAAAVYTSMHSDRTLQELQLQNSLRFIGVLGLCHTFPVCQKYTMGQGAAAAAWLAWLCMVSLDIARLQSPLFGWWVLQPLLFDSVLVMAHLWDTETSVGITMTSRLFFVATSGLYTLIFLLFS